MRLKRLLPLLLLVALAAGCGGYDYLLRSAEVRATMANEIQKGVTEYHTAAQADLAIAEDRVMDGHNDALLRLVAYMQANPGKLLPPAKEGEKERSPEEIVLRSGQMLRDQLGVIQSGKGNEAQRFTVLVKLLDAMRNVAAKDATIVMRQSNDIDQLKQLAEDALKSRFTSPLALPEVK
jgi:hypothetical protein